MAHTPYHNAAGKRVPSVTTIISAFRSSDALIHWAWQQGVDGHDYRDTKQTAATIGTIVHDYAEAAMKHKRFKLPSSTAIAAEHKLSKDDVKKVRRGWNAWAKWAKDNELSVTDQEVKLVSERLQFGGKFDVVAIQRDRSLIDYKTSKRLYLDHVIQIAAYGLLWRERYPCKACDGTTRQTNHELGMIRNANHKLGSCKKCKGTGTTKPIHNYKLIHLDKESGEFHVKDIPVSDIAVAEEIFTNYRRCYELKRQARKLYGIKN